MITVRLYRDGSALSRACPRAGAVACSVGNAELAGLCGEFLLTGINPFSIGGCGAAVGLLALCATFAACTVALSGLVPLPGCVK